MAQSDFGVSPPMNVDWAEEVLSRFRVRREWIESIHSECLSDEMFVEIIQFSYRHLQSGGRVECIPYFLKLADQSRFTASDWIESLGIFVRYLNQKSILADWETVTEYLQCASASQEALSGSAKLSDVVGNFLITEGFENRRIQKD